MQWSVSFAKTVQEQTICHPGGAGETVPRGAMARMARADRIRAYIVQERDTPVLRAVDCAAALGISVRSLHLALAAERLSFCGLVRAARLARACEILSRADAGSVADTAFACGFNSLSSFYRAFKQHVGSHPSGLRAI